MTGEKRFGSSMMGYKKSDVDTYVEIVINQCNHRLEKKDKEIAELKLNANNISESILEEKDAEIVQLKQQIIQMQTTQDEKNSEIEQIRLECQTSGTQENSELEHLKLQINEFTNEIATVYEKIAEKEVEIEHLHGQLNTIIAKNPNIEELEKKIMVEKDKVTNVLILASEKAENIILEANEQAGQFIEQAMLNSENERNAIEVLAESEREKLVDLKREMLDLKASIVCLLRKYEQEIDQTAAEM